MHPYFEKLSPHELNKSTILTGSIGAAFEDFRYRIKPDTKEGKVLCSTYTALSYEKAQDVEEREYTYDEPGVEEMKLWLQEQYEKYLRSRA
ncbi:MAG: hypothetical protein IJ788_00055 [Oscillospiraceae bacterium]|nr:hypothetical protein [Oscillospiraceae bacterium]